MSDLAYLIKEYFPYYYLAGSSDLVPLVTGGAGIGDVKSYKTEVNSEGLIKAASFETDTHTIQYPFSADPLNKSGSMHCLFDGNLELSIREKYITDSELEGKISIPSHPNYDFNIICKLAGERKFNVTIKLNGKQFSEDMEIGQKHLPGIFTNVSQEITRMGGPIALNCCDESLKKYTGAYLSYDSSIGNEAIGVDSGLLDLCYIVSFIVFVATGGNWGSMGLFLISNLFIIAAIH